MPQVIENDEGASVEVYTKEEVTAQTEAAVAAVKTESATAIEAKEKEIGDLKRINAERGENFTQYSKLTEEQKKAYDANTTELLRREEKLTNELQEFKTKFAEKETNERNYTKNTIMKNIHGDKDDVKKTLEDNYTVLAGMPESTPEEIGARAMAAARMAGISVDSVNPLYQSFNGEAPKPKEGKEFTDSAEGKTAADLVRQNLGIPTPKQ